MTQKTKTFCLSEQSLATSKVTEIDIASLLNRQGNCMFLLITHQLKTTSGS